MIDVILAIETRAKTRVKMARQWIRFTSIEIIKKERKEGRKEEKERERYSKSRQLYDLNSILLRNFCNGNDYNANVVYTVAFR